MIAMGPNLMKKFEVLLREKGYNLTKQRQIIWSVMVENLGKHLSINEIWEIAKGKDDTIGITTVYRTLKIMNELGIATSFDKKDEFNKYELNTDEKSYIHPHLICMRCGKIIDVAENLLIKGSIAKIHNEYNFEIENIRIKYYGICKECS